MIVLKLWNRDSPSMQIWTSNSLYKLVTKSSAISLQNINHSHKKSIFNSNYCLLVLQIIYITVYCITHINFYICGEMYWRKWHINTKVTCVFQWFLPLLLNNIYVLIKPWFDFDLTFKLWNSACTKNASLILKPW